MEREKFVINIGRQLGSGGKAVGQGAGGFGCGQRAFEFVRSDDDFHRTGIVFYGLSVKNASKLSEKSYICSL